MRTGIVIGAMGLAAYVAGAAPGWWSPPSRGDAAGLLPLRETVTPATGGFGLSSYARAVDAASPCVVTIIPEIHIVGGEVPPALAERLEERPGDGTVCKGIGSGVIVRADGYILTNNHVVEFADAIGVLVPGEPEPLRGRVVGVDPETDLAVVKIDSERTLPTILRADSDRLRIGDVVLALGNPFGIGPTVSLGIVSATGRGMGASDLEDYVQTDAPINLGCSGGALVDADGRLVGINTAIFSPRGTNIGIGFAISSNLAARICERLIEHGRVDRGRLGITVRVPDQGQAGGSRVDRVDDDAPAASAGLRVGDLVVAVDDVAVRSPQHLQVLVAGHGPGDRIELTVLREGEPVRVRARLGERSVMVPTGDEAGSGERMRAVKTVFAL